MRDYKYFKMIINDTKIIFIKDKTRVGQRLNILEVENDKVKEHTLFKSSWKNLRLKIQKKKTLREKDRIRIFFAGPSKLSSKPRFVFVSYVTLSKENT